MMPQMSGPEQHAKLRQLAPEHAECIICAPDDGEVFTDAIAVLGAACPGACWGGLRAMGSWTKSVVPTPTSLSKRSSPPCFVRDHRPGEREPRGSGGEGAIRAAPAGASRTATRT
jgi:hypothetical protein